MSTAYLVSAGSRCDYLVMAVFPDKESAEAYAQSVNDLCGYDDSDDSAFVEERPFFPAAPLAAGEKVWEVLFDAEGKATSVKRQHLARWSLYEEDITDLTKSKWIVWGTGQLQVRLPARDEDHAIKEALAVRNTVLSEFDSGLYPELDRFYRGEPEPPEPPEKALPEAPRCPVCKTGGMLQKRPGQDWCDSCGFYVLYNPAVETPEEAHKRGFKKHSKFLAEQRDAEPTPS